MSTASLIDALGPGELVEVQLVLRADRAELSAMLGRNAVPCAVTGRSDGWAVLRPAATVAPELLAVTLAAAFGTPVLIGCADRDDDVLGLLLLADERPEAARFFWGRAADGEEPFPTVVAEFARRLAGAFDRLEHEAELRGLLETSMDRDADGQWAALTGLLGLPDWVAGTEACSAVVVAPADQSDARSPAAIAGPSWLVPLGADWSALLPAGGAPTALEAVLPLAGGLSGAVGRRRPVLLLWLDGSGECGYLLLRHGRPVDSRLWNSRWQLVGDDPELVCEFDGPPGDAKRLAAAFDRPDVVVALRALLRRTGDPDRMLGELAALLGLPAQTLPLLRADLVPGAEFVERTSPLRAARDQVRATPELTLPPVLRSAYRLYAWGTVLAAVVCALMTALGLVEVLDDGSLDESGGRLSDAGWVLAFAVLTVVLSLTARWRLRRVQRASDQADVDGPSK